MNADMDYLPENTCPACFEGTLREGFQDYREDLGDGRQLLVKHLPARICEACGKAVYAREARETIEAELVKTLGSLTPDQVIELVEMTGLKEDELCELLGLGAKTIYRWRRGAQRPSKSLSILLAIVAHHRTMPEWVKEWTAGQRNPGRFCPQLDELWEKELPERFPHSRGRVGPFSAESTRAPAPTRFNPAMAFCTAEVA